MIMATLEGDQNESSWEDLDEDDVQLVVSHQPTQDAVNADPPKEIDFVKDCSLLKNVSKYLEAQFFASDSRKGILSKEELLELEDTLSCYGSDFIDRLQAIPAKYIKYLECFSTQWDRFLNSTYDRDASAGASSIGREGFQFGLLENDALTNLMPCFMSEANSMRLNGNQELIVEESLVASGISDNIDKELIKIYASLYKKKRLDASNSRDTNITFEDSLRNVFYEKYHWHKNRSLVPTKGDRFTETNTPSSKRDKWMQSKKTQGEADFWQRYSISLKKDGVLNEEIEFSQNLNVIVSIEKQKKMYESARSKQKAVMSKPAMSCSVQTTEKLFDILQKSGVPLEQRMQNGKVWLMETIKELYSLYQSCPKSSTQRKNNFRIRIFQRIGDVTVLFREYLSEEETCLLQTIFSDLQISSVARFQLELCGDLLLKEEESMIFRHDDVKFYPDKWQFSLLQLISNSQSVLVVAPTSAGKSFISFFVISEVLRLQQQQQNSSRAPKVSKAAKEGRMMSRCVFVAPSLPLANQMAAVIYHRYGSKNVGIFTSKFRNNEMNCNILICTPEIFDILLLSSAHQQWASELLYVIFDEIHCINSVRKRGRGSSDWFQDQAEEVNLGQTYSRILSMVRCPFLALSATISNPESFGNWLQSLHPHREVHLVTSSNAGNDDSNSFQLRWNDIKNWHFTPASIDGSSQAQLHPVHPIGLIFSCIDDEERVTKSLLYAKNLQLTPHECLLLYEALVQFAGEEHSVDRLEPEEHFKHAGASGSFSIKRVSRQECIRYQQELLNELNEWPYLKQIEVIAHLYGAGNPAPMVKQLDDEFSALYDLLMHAKKSKLTPALCFHPSVIWMEEFIEYCMKRFDLIDKDNPVHYRPSSVWDAGEDEFEPNDDIEENQESGKKKKKTVEKRNRNGSLDAKLREFGKQMQSVSSLSCFFGDLDDTDNKKASPVFKLYNSKETYWWIKRLFKKLGWSSTHILLRALMRGIGIYHPSIGKPYRDVVEVMFRAGLLSVVISNKQLAYGINMPCKTVVFPYSSGSFIKGADFHQMSGRAGRRGFDTEGHRIFLGFKERTAHRLIFTPQLSLISSNPVDCDTALRMCIFLHEAKDKAKAQEQMQNLLRMPFNSGGAKPLWFNRSEFTLRLSLEYLQQMKLIDHMARPIGLAGLVAHNFTSTPGNFFIAFLIQSGFLTSLCDTYLPDYQGSKSKKDTQEELFAVLAYCLHPKPIRAGSRAENATEQKKLSLHPYSNILDKCWWWMEEHNRKVKKTAVLGTNILLQERRRISEMMEEDDQLSEKDESDSDSDEEDENVQVRNDGTDDSDEQHELQEQMQEEQEVQPVNDEETQIRNAKRKRFLLSVFKFTQSLLPFATAWKPEELSSYAVQFFKNGMIERIVYDFGIPDGVVYCYLQQWDSDLRKILAALQTLVVDPDKDPLCSALNDIVTQFHNSFAAV